MEGVALDILGPLPKSKNGHRYILVMCHLFTKWTEAYPLPDQEAQTVAKAIVDCFVSRFGTPLQLHSDQGTNFQSKIFQELCDLLHIKKTRTTSMHPQANGTVERLNRTLTAMM
ncbi:hypothetical protein ACJMK2_002094 [Sinanodonta woodiana]|uniref:Integrase catalytic domain-containing protein n=1 Tax=Sinanodonta woodiana TaxID=1069815 RepID=A0ABD3XVW0_SINWO